MSRFCDGYTFVPGKYGKLISFFKIARFFSETIGLSPLFLGNADGLAIFKLFSLFVHLTSH